jgi:SAM-dependent methyltransferase
MSTDHAWREWGERDPYFAVITDPGFRRDALDERALDRFFGMGEHHAKYVLDLARRHVDPRFAPRRILDFGCGVGRVLLPFAAHAELAVGVDISPAMLAEARLNAERRGVANVELLQSDDSLSLLQGQFDLVHSAIVFQHIDVQRGRRLFQRLLDVLAPGGIGAIQITYGKSRFPENYGLPPAPPPTVAPPPAPPAAAMVEVDVDGMPKSNGGWFARWRGVGAEVQREATTVPVPTVEAPAKAPTPPGVDPEMQMNPYSLSELAFMMQRAGVQKFFTTFTDHGGELGVFLFFQRPTKA